MLVADLTELKKLRSDLLKVGERVKDKPALLDSAGKYMTLTEIPLVFREQGPGWKASRRGGKTLRDTGALAASIVYSVEGDTLTVGSNLPYAPIHNFGGTITGKGKFLAIPDDSLSKAEKKNFDLRAWKNTWVKPSGNGYTVYQKGARDQVRIIAHLVHSVDIPQRKFLDFGTRALDAISRRWTKLVMEGK
jgi:phage gpG-like protein